MMLSPDRLSRFARHIVLPEVGGAGQVALSRAHVVLIGCGGIGSPALQYLAAAGVGRLTLVDDDAVEDSNLQRQTVFGTADIGQPKAEAAALWASRFDPALDVRAVVERIGRDNAGQIIAGGSVVLDGCDNFATRLAVSDACVAAGIPLASARSAGSRARLPISPGILPAMPVTAASSATLSMPRTATPARPTACLGRWPGWSAASRRCRQFASSSPATPRSAIRNGASCTCSTAWRRRCGR